MLTCTRVMLFVSALVCLFVSLVDAAGTVTCQCCNANSCGWPAPTVGTVSVASCSDYDSSVCYQQFPSSCTAGQGVTQASCSSSSSTPTNTYSWSQTSVGECSASCGGGTRTVSYQCVNQNSVQVSSSYCSGSNPSGQQTCNTQTCANSGTALNWEGTFNTNNECDSRTCCCVYGQVSIVKTGSQGVISGGLTGVCGTASSFRETVAWPTSSSLAFSMFGQQSQFTLSSDSQTITQRNLGASQCSGSITRSTASVINWEGTFKTNNECDSRTCCCVYGQVSIVKSGSQGIISGGLTGLCGSVSSFRETVTWPTSSSFTASVMGQQSQFTLSSDSETITQQNLGASQCSGSITRTGSNGASSASVAAGMLTIALIVVSLIM